MSRFFKKDDSSSEESDSDSEKEQKTVPKNKKVFVITHNSHLKSLLYSSKKITVTKKKGVSDIKGRK